MRRKIKLVPVADDKYYEGYRCTASRCDERAWFACEDEATGANHGYAACDNPDHQLSEMQALAYELGDEDVVAPVIEEVGP